MIVLNNVSYSVASAVARTTILTNISAVLPTDKHLIVLGKEGTGKSSLIRLIAGQMLPDSGRIYQDGRISYPVGFVGGFKRHLNVRENISHVARLYGAEVDEVVEFVSELAQLKELTIDFEDLSQQQRVRVAYAASYAIPFDCYLVDNMVAAGDYEFKVRCEKIFERRMQSSGCIIATRVSKYARRFGRIGAILDGTGLTLYEDLDQAIWTFERSEAAAMA